MLCLFTYNNELFLIEYLTFSHVKLVLIVILYTIYDCHSRNSSVCRILISRRCVRAPAHSSHHSLVFHPDTQDFNDKG